MKKYVQIDKDTKRVICYSSNSANSQEVLEMAIDSEVNKELFENPFIYKFDELNNVFIKDVDYQNKLIFERENRLTDDKKINKLTKELAKTKIENMQKDAMISMLIREQAKTKIEKMKVGA